MSVISKDLASQIAVKLTEKSRKAAEKMHIEFKELVTSVYEDQTPQMIKDCLKKHPEWVGTGSSIRLDGHGFRWEYVSTTRPIILNSNTQALLKMTSQIGDKLTSSKRKWEKAKEKYDKLKDESKQALLTLKTFANIRKELPEAAQFLPPPLSNALVVNFSSLKKQLSQQPDDKVTA